MSSFFIRVKDNIKAWYRLDVDYVVKEYDAFLQYSLVTTSSFQDILSDQYNWPLCISVLRYGYLNTPADPWINVEPNRKLALSFVTHVSTLLKSWPNVFYRQESI